MEIYAVNNFGEDVRKKLEKWGKVEQMDSGFMVNFTPHPGVEIKEGEIWADGEMVVRVAMMDGRPRVCYIKSAKPSLKACGFGQTV